MLIWDNSLMEIRNLLSDLFDHWKSYVDAANLLVILGAIVNIIPAITAVLSLVWICIRIYETETVQKMIYGEIKVKAKDDDPLDTF